MVKSITIKLLILISGIIIIFIIRNNDKYPETINLVSEKDIKDIRVGHDEEETDNPGPVTSRKIYQTGRTTCLEGLININEADADQLLLLPGIGEKLAGEIIRHRKENSGYKTIDEIMNVKGIKEKRYSGIAKYLSVSGRSSLKQCGDE